jgi:hypothetical protein
LLEAANESGLTVEEDMERMASDLIIEPRGRTARGGDFGFDGGAGASTVESGKEYLPGEA